MALRTRGSVSEFLLACIFACILPETTSWGVGGSSASISPFRASAKHTATCSLVSSLSLTQGSTAPWPLLVPNASSRAHQVPVLAHE